jgi:cytosol aminopeptidase family protein
MELRLLPFDLRRLDDAGAEIIACTIWSDERPMRGLAGLLDWRFAGRLSNLAKEGFLVGSLGEVLLVPGRPHVPFEKVLVFGLGNRSGFGDGVYRTVLQHLLRALEGLHVRRAVVELPGRSIEAVEPERAAEILLECAGDSPVHDAWWLVEKSEVHARIKQRAIEERRRVRHA